MSSLYEDIKRGLEEAIAYNEGRLAARKTTMSVAPLSTFTAAEIKGIRNSTGMSQALFAKYMGVSVKTVEAWEAGRNHPEGAACRMLAITKANPSFPTSSGIIARY